MPHLRAYFQADDNLGDDSEEGYDLGDEDKNIEEEEELDEES